MSDSKDIILYDHHGEPIEREVDFSQAEVAMLRSMVYNMALRDTKSPAQRRAQNPYCNHPWVYSSASANSDNLSQVDFIVWRETEAAQDERARIAFRDGYIKSEKAWVPKCGRDRTAIQRHFTKRRYNGKVIKALEPDLNHPLTPVLRRPNPIMTGKDLWKATDVFFQVRGAAFWLIITPDGTPWFPGDQVESIIPLHPDDINPVLDRRTMRLAAWQFDITNRSEGLGLGAEGTQRRFMPQELVHFKNFNADKPLNGLSPLNPIAGNIIQDLMTQQVNTAILENGADPGGILTSEAAIDPKEKRKMVKRWHDRHGGPHNRRKIAILDGNIKWQQTSMSPSEMQFEQLGLSNRESVMAVLRTNKSVLGLTEDINHATHLAQDRAFWQRSLLPRVKHYEGVIDVTLMFSEPDTTLAGFKLEDVEALQEDLTHKIENATKLCGPEIHMPPEIALDLVGIDVADYVGDEVALLPPMLTTVEDILGNPLLENDNENDNEEDTDNDEGNDPDDSDESPQEEGRSPRRLLDLSRNEPSTLAQRRGFTTKEYRSRVRKNRTKIRDLYSRLIAVQEKPFRSAMKAHMFGLRKDTLANFEKVAAGKKAIIRADLFSPEEIERILFETQQANRNLSKRTLALYQAILESIVEFTDKEMGGLFAFDIASERVQKFINAKIVQINGVNRNVRRNVRTAIIAGLANGEDVSGIRSRIKSAFNIQQSPARLNRIARTETAQMMGGIRQIIFREEGVRRIEWVTAGDEVVRPDHQLLGTVGPVEIGHNFMDDLGKSGTLEFPSDPRGPANQIINCRCVAVAVE